MPVSCWTARALKVRATLQAKILEAKILQAKILEAKRLQAKIIQAKNDKAKILEAKRLQAKILEAKGLQAKILEAKIQGTVLNTYQKITTKAIMYNDNVFSLAINSQGDVR